MNKKYRYFKHITQDLLTTQSIFTEKLIKESNHKSNEAFFEVQVEICGVMQSRVTKYSIDEWIEITNKEFIKLITNNNGKVLQM
jgi:hypothetical protein